MKKILTLTLTLSLSVFMLTACGSSASKAESTSKTESASTTENASTNESDSIVESTPSTESADAIATEPDKTAEITSIFHGSKVDDLKGKWTLSQVYAGGEILDAKEKAMEFEITMALDPSELVDEAAYIHNQVYNLTAYLTFGIEEINNELTEQAIDSYKGSTGWKDFAQGKVVDEGAFYIQNGAASMRLKGAEDCGLYLDKIAGASADIDTTEKTLIIGMNNYGQVLLGYSEEDLQKPGTEGEWTYCLIFDKNS